MAPRPRGRNRKNKMVGNTRMEAALDAMRPFGFEEQLVRETVEGLLDVYEGEQGWPFIEDASYKLLIETLLSNQPSSVEEKKKEDCLQLQDVARTDGHTEASSTAPTTGIKESLLQSSDDLGSASQINDQDCASLDIKDLAIVAERDGGHGKGMMVESKNELNPAANITGSNNSTVFKNLESTFVRPPVIQSLKPLKNLPLRKRKPCYGWISSDEDEDDDEDSIHLPQPQLEKLLGQSAAPQSGGRQRRKSRLDEKPDDT